MTTKKIFLTIIFASFVFNSALPTISSTESNVYSGIAGVSAGTIVGCVLWSKLQRMQKKLDELKVLEKRSFLENLDSTDLLILDFLQRNKSVFFATFLGGQDKELRRFLLTASASALSAIAVYFLTHYFSNGFTFDSQLKEVDKDIESLLRRGVTISEREKKINGNKVFAELKRLRKWEFDSGCESSDLQNSLDSLNDAFLSWTAVPQHPQQPVPQQPGQSNQPNSYPGLDDVYQQQQPVYQEPVFNQGPRYEFSPIHRISISRQRSSWQKAFDIIRLIDLFVNIVNSARQE